MFTIHFSEIMFLPFNILNEGFFKFHAAATAKSLQSCSTLCDPKEGFSRQEYWSGLPFPSPMQESEVTQSCPTRHNPMDYMQLTRLLRP